MNSRRLRPGGLQPWLAEWPLPLAFAIFLTGISFRSVLSAGSVSDAWLAIAFAGLFVGALFSAFSAVRHAELLAHRFGEPYGTLLLTLSVISIEVATIATVMLHGKNDPRIARDTMYAVVMIVLNGAVGVSLLVGGLKHREQVYNLQGANAYLSLLIPLAVLTMIWPDFTPNAAPGLLSAADAGFLIAMSVLLYCVFLGIQTMRHRSYFAPPDEYLDREQAHGPRRSWIYHAVLLLANLLLVIFTAKIWALPLDIGMDRLGLPEAGGAVALAILVLAPESLAAIRAAAANEMQRSTNLALGSALATVSLTAPAVLAISLTTGRSVILGLPPAETVLLILTFGVSMLTFSSGRTNVMQGLIHLLLFFAFGLLIFSV